MNIVEQQENAVLREKEVQIKEQAVGEIQELLDEVENELKKDYALIVASIDKKIKNKEFFNKESRIEETKEELITNQQFEATYNYKQSIKNKLAEDIRKGIKMRIESEIFKNEQEKVFKAISEEFTLHTNSIKKKRKYL